MKRQEKRNEANETRGCYGGLYVGYGVTRKFKIRNEHIRGTTRVAQAAKKSRETIEMVRPCDEGR